MALKNETSLDDLALFLAVADTGALTRAAERSGIPLPTVSRRMRQLEAQLSRALFLRGAQGMGLTEDGRSLAGELRGLDEVRNRLARWQQATTRTPVVRITAGDWTTIHLARVLPAQRDWHPAFVATAASLDIARREADIGLRSIPPDHPWLARQRLCPVTYAIYGTDAGVTGYVGPTDPTAAPPSLRWLTRTHPDEITLTTSSPRLALDLAANGLARAVLPCFIGEAADGLTRLSDDIDALTHDQWLVSHQDARNDPPIRAVLTEISRLLSP